MIPDWLKSLFSNHPVLCRSCSKRDVVITIKPMSWAQAEQFCCDGVAGFPYRRDCKRYEYTWIYGDVDQENK